MKKPLTYIQHECEAIALDEEEQQLLKYLSEGFDFENNSEDFLDFSVDFPFDLTAGVFCIPDVPGSHA